MSQGNLSTGFWARHDTRGTFVSKEEKRRMVDTGEVFTVIEVTEREQGRFGPEWVLTIQRNTGEITSLTFAKNAYRDTMMSDLREEVSVMHGLDCSLEMFRTDAGNEAYSLCPPRQDDTVQAPF